jgi:septal ring factor EnvC (AmiA/AmiB activator)
LPKGTVVLKLEKRSSGAADQEMAEETSSNKKKPVVVYIMILFIVAFILMAVSFVMHQRSNTEVMGKLQDSVTALQEVQNAQDENVQLQDQLKDAQKKNEELQEQLDDVNAELDSADDQLAAMSLLYTLQQQYAAGDTDDCKATISYMENKGLDKLLPAEAESDDITSPAQRYLQLREAVSGK